MNDEKYKCIVCNNEKLTLISVISTLDAGSCFMYNRGICQNCLLHGDLDKICKEFRLNKAEETIKQIEENLQFWKDEQIKIENEQ